MVGKSGRFDRMRDRAVGDEREAAVTAAAAVARVTGKATATVVVGLVEWRGRGGVVGRVRTGRREGRGSGGGGLSLLEPCRPEEKRPGREPEIGVQSRASLVGKRCVFFFSHLTQVVRAMLLVGFCVTQERAAASVKASDSSNLSLSCVCVKGLASTLACHSVHAKHLLRIGDITPRYPIYCLNIFRGADIFLI